MTVVREPGEPQECRCAPREVSKTEHPNPPKGRDAVVQMLVLVGIPAATLYALATGRLNAAGAAVFGLVFVHLVCTDRLG